jgi:ABC-type transporter Mla subunit MlaD
MSTGVVFWIAVVGGLGFAAAVGLAVALLPPHGGEDEFRAT